MAAALYGNRRAGVKDLKVEITEVDYMPPHPARDNHATLRTRVATCRYDVNIVAYILQVNGVKAGNAKLPATGEALDHDDQVSAFFSRGIDMNPESMRSWRPWLIGIVRRTFRSGSRHHQTNPARIAEHET